MSFSRLDPSIIGVIVIGLAAAGLILGQAGAALVGFWRRVKS
ncbi:MAG: hypothetical protein ABI400_07165 [Lacisediminihabitans sp.]